MFAMKISFATYTLLYLYSKNGEVLENVENARCVKSKNRGGADGCLRVRSRRPESAHSQARECAVAGPRVRTLRRPPLQVPVEGSAVATEKRCKPT